MSKPQKNYVTPAVRTLALLAGGCVAFLFWIILTLFGNRYAFLWALMLGAGAALLCAAALALWIRSADRRYRDVEVELGDEIRFEAQANVTSGDVSRNGYLFLTADRLIACFRDREPYARLTFSRSDGREIRELSPVSMNITDSGHSFEIVTADCDVLLATMRDMGWTVLSSGEEET